MLEDRRLLSVAPLGDEMLVHRRAAEPQGPWAGSEAVAVRAAGDFVVAFDGAGQGDSEGVLVRRFDAQGNTVGNVLRANRMARGAQRDPSVAIGEQGDFVVVWAGAGPGDASGVFVQQFLADGRPVGTNRRVSVTARGEQEAPVVAMRADGGFIVAWSGRGVGDASGVFYRLFDAQGRPLGSELRAGATVRGVQRHPDLATAADGRFLVAWDGSGPSDNQGVFARWFQADASPEGGEFRVNTTARGPQADASVAIGADGRFALAWSGNGPADAAGIYFQRFHADGTADGSETLVNAKVGPTQTNPSLAMAPDGSMVVVWNCSLSGSRGWEVYGRQFDPAGQASGVPFRVSGTARGDQRDATVAMDGSGNLVVAWNGWGHRSHRSYESYRTYGTNRTDRTGASSVVQGLFVRRFDAAPPAITAALANDTGQSSTDGLTSDPTIEGRITDAGQVTTFAAGLDGMADSSYVSVLDRVQPDGTFRFDRAALQTILGGPLPDGPHTVHLKAADEYGYVAPTFDLSFTLDTVPVVELDPAFDTSPLGDRATTVDTVTLIGRTEPHRRVVLEQTGTTAEADDRGHFSLAFVPLSLGENRVTVTATDPSGLTSQSVRIFTRLPFNRQVTSDPGVQQMPSIAVDPLDSQHLVLAYMDYSLVTADTDLPGEGYAGIGVAVSYDGGNRWQYTSIPLPAGFDQGAANPIAKFDDRGHVFVSFMAATFLAEKPPLTNPNFWNPERSASDREFGFQANNGVFVARSDDGGLNWNEPAAVASHLYNGEDEVFFEIIPDLAIDTFPTLPDGQPNPSYGNLYVAWSRLYPVGQFPGHPDYNGGIDIMIAVSRDAGGTWETQFQEEWNDANGDGVRQDEESYFASVVQDAENTLGLPGLGIVDQARLAIGPDGVIYLTQFGGGDFAIHRSEDGGASFASPDHATGRRIAFGTGFSTYANTDGLPTNHFRTHTVRALAADPSRPGQVYAVEPVQVFDSVGNEADPADVRFARSTDYGETWQSQFTVGGEAAENLNDDNGGRSAAAAGPEEVVAGQGMARMAVDAQGNISVIWYDTRRDPAGHLLDVFGTVSTNGGQTFSPNFRIAEMSFDADAGRFMNAVGGEEFYLGDLIGLAMADNTAYAAWTDTRGGNQDIVFTRYRTSPAPAPLNDRFEPDGVPQLDGTPTDLGRVVQRVLPKLAAPPGDDDWFLMEAAAAGDVIAAALYDEGTPVPAEGLRLELWDASAAALLSVGEDIQDATGTLLGREVRFPAAAGQTFLVHVSNSAVGAGGPSVSYSLRLQSLTANLGTRARAGVAGTLAAGGGALYAVAAAAAGSVDLRLTAADNVQGDLNVQILDADTFVTLASGRPFAAPPLTAPSIEPNDSINQASPTGLAIPGSVTVESVVGDGPFGATSGDYDFFRFEAGASQRITVMVDAGALGSSLDSMLLLYAGDGTLLQAVDSAGGGGKESASFVTTQSGVYYAAVAGWESGVPADPFSPGGGANAGSTGAFRVVITTEAVGPGAVKTATLPVEQGQRLLLLINGEEGSSGDFSLEFRNLDQFTTPGSTSLFFPAGAGPSQAAVGDINGDQRPDLVVSNALTSTLSVLLGDGDGMFQSPRQFPIGAFVTAPGDIGRRLPTFGRDVAIADFNGDGLADVAVTNSASADVSILLGRGDGTFEPQRRFNATAMPFALDVGDLNGDAIPDLAVVSSASATATLTVAALLGRGDGTFLPQRTVEVVSGGVFNPGSLRIGEVNGDGIADVVVSGQNQPLVSVLIGNGDGTFTPAGDLLAHRLGAGMTLGDVNGDGSLDIVNVGFEQNEASVLLGNGDGTFQAAQFFFAGQGPIAVEIADAGSPSGAGGSSALGPPDGRPDLVVANSGGVIALSRVGIAEVVVLPGLWNDQGAFVGFGSPSRLAVAEGPQDLDVADVNGDGVLDVAVVDRDGVIMIYGRPPVVAPNSTPGTARDLGTVVHLLEPTLTIVPGHEDAYYRLTVPTEALQGAGDEVIDFSGLFEHEEGAGLNMEVRDLAGNLLGSGERFRIVASRGQELLLHVFGVADAQGNRGAGAYTLDIDVLPQVVLVEAHALLPGQGDNPGGPTTSIVVTLQGDRLDPDTAEDPANYAIIWAGPDGQLGTGDDQPIVIGGAGIAQPVVYHPGANVEIATGMKTPTAVRQTLTLLFAEALPAGSYRVELSPEIQTAAFSEAEAGLLAGGAAFAGHPVVSVQAGQVQNGSRIAATDLVLESVGLGDLSIFKEGTAFLTQLHDDLSALLDGLLTKGQSDRLAITDALNDHVLARLAAGLGPVGQRTTSALVIWLDPVSIDLIDPADLQLMMDLMEASYLNQLSDAYVNVDGMVELLVIPDPIPGGAYNLNVSDVPPTATGGVLYFGPQETTTQSLTSSLQSGITSYSFTF